MFRPAQLKPDVGRSVNLDAMDPETMARFFAAQEHPLIRWLVRLISAARTIAKQRYLYAGYRARKPGFNKAANPDWIRPDGSKGSRHMVQSYTGYAYALDLWRPKSLPWVVVHRVFKQFGLRFPVRGEAWHTQALIRFDDDRNPVYYDIAPKRQAAVEKWRQVIAAGVENQGGLAKVAEFVEACRQTTLRKGDNGPAVQFLQKLLNHADSEVAGQRPRWHRLVMDGDYGPLTLAAVWAFQRDSGLVSDGVCGRKTWAALLDG